MKIVYGMINMNEKFKVKKVKTAKGFPAMEVYNSDTDNVLILSKYDIWHLWCDVVR